MYVRGARKISRRPWSLGLIARLVGKKIKELKIGHRMVRTAQQIEMGRTEPSKGTPTCPNGASGSVGSWRVAHGSWKPQTRAWQRTKAKAHHQGAGLAAQSR